MTIRALNLTDTWEVGSKHDPDRDDTEKAAVFEIRPLDSRIAGRLRDKATKMRIRASDKEDEGTETSINSNDVNFEVCQYGIAGWINVEDDKGVEVECVHSRKTAGAKTYDVVREDCLCRLPMAVIRELAEKIMEKNEVTPDEGKD